MINPWLGEHSNDLQSLTPGYYLERLKSREFWNKLLKGQVQIGHAVGGAIQSISDQYSPPDDPPTSLSRRMAAAIEASPVRVLTVLAGRASAPQAFAAWQDERTELALHFETADQCIISEADHFFSAPAHWREVCEWLSNKLAEISIDS
jgi:hypothetical protein